MALTREEKVERVAEYVESLKQSQGIIVVDYQGMNVGEMEELRGAMRPAKGQLQVIKNRLLALALEKVDISLPDNWLNGPTAIGFCRDEVPPVAKALVEAREETGKPSLKGGWLNAVLSDEQVESIAKLPSREVLFAQLLGNFNAPSRRIAGAVAGGLRQIVNVLQAHVDKLEEAEAEPETDTE